MRHALPVLITLAAAFAAPSPASAASRQPDGGHAQAPADHVSDALIARLAAEATENIEQLRRDGRLPKSSVQVSGLGWPLGPAPGIGEDWHGISNFVDLDPDYPNQLLDYTGGTRTYDTTSGYNHRGIDYFIGPFPWMLLDQGAIEVRAVAAGTLVGRADAFNDRSCSMNAPDTPNYVSIHHADGTLAYYLHMKKGSVTTLPIGSAIPAGTVLGRVGSSGVSTGPHLHLELRANATPGAAVIEPHTGPANPGPSLFAEQRPYRDSAIGRITTHSAPPVSPTCSGNGTMTGTDTPNLATTFMPGDPIIYLAAYRDQGRGQVANFRVLRPDLSVAESWSFDSAQVNGTPEYYSGSYWYWNDTIPANAPHGLWTFESTFQGETKTHTFTVGDTTTAIGDMKGLIGAWFEPATSGQGFELHWINGNMALLFFYGHHDDGENFFLLGQRDGAWDFGQEVEFSMYATTGGRWTDFDPAQIQRTTWGTLRITFVDCENAVAELDGADGTKVMTLERLGRTEGLDCGL